MRTAVQLLLVFAVLTFHASMAEADSHDWSLALLPIVMNPGEVLEGAHGSEWRGEFWVHSTAEVGFGLQGPCEVEPCPGVGSGLVGVLDGIRSRSVDSGALIIVPSDSENKIHFANRIYESAGGAQPLGVEIPIVREKEFLTTTTEFVGIPVDPLNRMTLRIYDPRRMEGSSVLVEILSPTTEVLASTTLAPGNFEAMALSEDYPGYDAIFNLVGTFPQLASYETVHVRLTPLTEGMEYWAFLSITDNATQHVALYTPQ